jgi:AcrR family transcriptional regulator
MDLKSAQLATVLRTEDTRQRLLDAAGEVFAEHGFRSATIQEICRRANANIAGVNYHFGDKERLYAAVFEYAERCALPDFPLASASESSLTAEERLRNHIRGFLLRILDDGRSSWFGKLIAREMTEPTPLLDKLVREKFAPVHEHLAGIVKELLGPTATPETVRLCTLSIRGQCLFYRNCRPAIERLFPDLRLDRPAIDRLADEISEFSLAAIRGLARKRRKTKPRCS